LSASANSSQNFALRDPDVRLRNDDAAAFEELVVRYQQRLVNILSHLVGGDPELAEDLAQETFLRVYRTRKRYVPGAKFSTWLFTIANNVASNARRTLARRREVALPAPVGASTTSAMPIDQLAQAASGLMPTRQADKAEMREVVRQALSALNERQRLAVLLNKFENMGYADIAETMQMSPQAVKSLLSRAREQLRTVLEPYLAAGRRTADRNGNTTL
jgi:RNA polymerase sigma-70 factor (ECF subfamily)